MYSLEFIFFGDTHTTFTPPVFLELFNCLHIFDKIIINLLRFFSKMHIDDKIDILGKRRKRIFNHTCLNPNHQNDKKVKIIFFPVWLRNRLISARLKPVTSHT